MYRSHYKDGVSEAGGPQCGQYDGWCDYNPSPTINSGNPLCVIESTCPDGNLCDLETQRCAKQNSGYTLVETDIQCPLKPATTWVLNTAANAQPAEQGATPPQWGGFMASEKVAPGGPDKSPAAQCTGAGKDAAPWNFICPKICQKPGLWGWDSGIGMCSPYMGGMSEDDDLVGGTVILLRGTPQSYRCILCWTSCWQC